MESTIVSKGQTLLTLLASIAALLAVQARVCKPLNAYAITNLHGTFDGVLANSNNLPYTFMPANKRHFGIKRPIIITGVQVRVADPSTEQFDEAFAWSELRRLLDRIIPLDFESSSMRWHDCGDLCRWNARHDDGL
jgi:hypothetical protein